MAKVKRRIALMMKDKKVKNVEISSIVKCRQLSFKPFLVLSEEIKRITWPKY